MRRMRSKWSESSSSVIGLPILAVIPSMAAPGDVQPGWFGGAKLWIGLAVLAGAAALGWAFLG